METLTEPGVLPHNHLHSPHPYLSGASGTTSSSGVHSGFFSAASMDGSTSAATSLPVPVSNGQSSYGMYSRMPGGQSAGATAQACFPPYPYSKQQQQSLDSPQQVRDTASSGSSKLPSHYPQNRAQQYPAMSRAEPDFSRHQSTPSDTFGRTPATGLSPFPRPTSPSFHHGQPQASMLQGIRPHHTSPGGPVPANRGVDAAAEDLADMSPGSSRRDAQSPFTPEAPDAYRNQNRPGGVSASRQAFLPQTSGIDQDSRHDTNHKPQSDNMNFVAPFYYDKPTNRGGPGYGATMSYNSAKNITEVQDFGYMHKQDPAFLDSVKGMRNFQTASGNKEAEAMAYDNECLSAGDNLVNSGEGMGMKNRDRLDRSVSHDAQSVVWSAELTREREERNTDGRPHRSMTLDSSLNRRYPKPGSFVYGGYCEREDYSNYSHVPDRRPHPPQHQQDIHMERPGFYRAHDHKGQSDSMMMSPAKPTRRLSETGRNSADPEAAAVPQQSPNRPPPHHPSPSSCMPRASPIQKSERHTQATVSPPHMRDGQSEGEVSNSQAGGILSDWGPSPSKTTSTSSTPPTDSPSFASAGIGEQLNKSNLEGSLYHHRDEDEDDVDGDRRTGSEENNSFGGDAKPPCPPLQSQSQDGDGSSSSNSSNRNNGDRAAPFFDNNSSVNAREAQQRGRHSSRGGDSGDTMGDDCDLDGGLTAKRELFSEDEDDDDSQDINNRRDRFQGGSPPLSMSPPSPDSFMTYPPSYPHPFFSPGRGMPAAMPFGSSRAGPAPDCGPGFPFGKDFHGRFPMSGTGRPPEMNMGGPPEMGMAGMGRVCPQRGRPSHHRFMNPMGGLEDDKDIYFCHLCSYSGKTKSDFDAHMSVHFEFNCPHCDYTSRTEGRLKRHIKDFHSDDSSRRSMPGRPKIYRCKQCPFSAKEKDKFWEHARSHIKEDKLLQCPKCSFVTEYKHHLEYHLRNHFGSKPFKCNKCNYSCVNKSMLNSHMKSHTNVYQYRCSECTYATKYCHSLKLHLKKYGHKPATVLNQDGSLPQGLDVDASGLSVATKRGPPRGPRGPRKDKSGGGAGNGGDPYLSQLFGMPPVPMGVPGMGPHGMNAINPMLNGMMPFWPMLPGPGGLPPGHPHHPHNRHHPSPPQPGMLPGMGNLARQMGLGGEAGMMPSHGMDFDAAPPSSSDGQSSNKANDHELMDRRPHSVSSDGRISGPRDDIGESNRRTAFPGAPHVKDDFAACNLCDFVADNTRALCMHYVDVHKEEQGRDFRRDFGMIAGDGEISRGERIRAGPPFFQNSDMDRSRRFIAREGGELDRRRMSEPPVEALSGHGQHDNDHHRRNSLTGLLSSGNPGSMRVNSGDDEATDESWPTGTAFPDRERAKRMDICYPSLQSTPEEDAVSKGIEKEEKGMNILHEMTLKFGDGAPIQRDASRNSRSPQPKSPVARASDGEPSGFSNRDSEAPKPAGSKPGRGLKETPLDLTKPKSDSPSDLENTGSPAEFGDDYDANGAFRAENGCEAKVEEGKSLSKVTEILLRKRPFPEEATAETSTTDNTASAIMPRKRSRKGKAYKLDTLCLKLQEQRTNPPHDSDGNESDLELNFSGFQPLNPVKEKSNNEDSHSEDYKQKDEDALDKNTREEKDASRLGVNDNDGIDSDGTEEYNNDEKKDDFEEFKEAAESFKTVAEFDNKQEKTTEREMEEKEQKELLTTAPQQLKERENVETTSIDASKVCKISDEGEPEEGDESDFEELQRSLKMLNGAVDSTENEAEKKSSETESLKNSAETPDHTIEREDTNHPMAKSPSPESVSNHVKLESGEGVGSSPLHEHLSECHSDKENSDGLLPPSRLNSLSPSYSSNKPLLNPASPTDSRQAKLEPVCAFDSEEEIDQADLIHTVMENRKKPLPPAVRRGTELAWKLLNDPVNPVTSLPIPVAATSSSTAESGSRESSRPVSPKQHLNSRPRPSSPGSAIAAPPPPFLSSNQAMPMSPRPGGVGIPAPSSPLRNGMRHHSPAYRQMHPYPQGQPLQRHSHPHPHQHYQPPPPLHRSNHPLFPSHYGPPQGLNSVSSSPSSPSLKPPPLSGTSPSSMPIPLPPTPMAFIPPTNRMERHLDQTQSLGLQGGVVGSAPAKPAQPPAPQHKSELYECTYCDLTFRDCVMYTVHMGYHSNRNPFKCNSCGIICRDKVEFFLHIARSPHA